VTCGNVPSVSTVGHGGSANGQFVELPDGASRADLLRRRTARSGVPAGISGADLDADSR
jgi:hypothetical protein